MRESRRNAFALLAALVTVLAFGGAASANRAEEGPLSIGVTGSTPDDPRSNPIAILASPKVQRLVLEVAERPHSRREITAALAGEPFSLEDMVRVGLLREEAGERFRIDFNLLRVADQSLILRLSRDAGKDLAAAFLARRAELEALAGAHGQPHVGTGEVLYAVLGCFALDWEGLDLTEARGWRAGAQRTIEGRSFTPWAKEKGAEISLKGLYWGSHNTAAGGFVHTTFGDHHSLPRFGMPDMMWDSMGAFRRYEEDREGRRAAGRMLSAYMTDAMKDAASVMMTLRTGDRSMEDLAASTGIGQEKLERLLGLLLAAEYADRRGDLYRGRVVVLGPEDAGLVAEIVAKSREIIEAWHADHYDRLRAAASDLTPLRNGVPFERVYTSIWHFVFAMANRELVEAGLLADPYADTRLHKGFLPVIWAEDLPVSMP